MKKKEKSYAQVIHCSTGCTDTDIGV